MNKFDRVISTLILLQTKKIIKAASISEKFGISLRTVYRDVNTLKNAGIPIIGDPGIGYSIMDGYRLPPIMFNEGEALALLTAEKLIATATDKETIELYTSAMNKIKAILRSSEKKSLDLLDKSISFHQPNSTEHKSYLQDLFKSIANQSILKIAYIKADGTASVRQIEPIGCYNQNNKWYLVAYCQLKEDYRTFLMNRIQQLSVLDKIFERKHMSLQHYLEIKNEVWTNQHNFQQVEISFNKEVVQYANSRKYYFNLIKEEIEDNAVRMTFLIPSLEFMARWLLQFTNQATVISPQKLQEKMQVLAKEMYEHYLN